MAEEKVLILLLTPTGDTLFEINILHFLLTL